MGNVDSAKRYVAKMPPAVSGQSGHATTFRVALVLHRFGLSQTEALEVLREYNQRCSPVWSESELRHKLTDAFEQPVHKPLGGPQRRGGRRGSSVADLIQSALREEPAAVPNGSDPLDGAVI